jgi:hypothetical protein
MKKNKSTNNDLQSMHIKLKIELSELHYKPEINSGALEWSAVTAPLLKPVVLL